MSVLVFKLLVTPLLIGAASVAGRRWGPMVGGWIVGLPLTSGPVAAFLAVERGSEFAAAAAVGILAGTVSQALFALAYARAPRSWGWGARTVVGSGVFALCTVVFDRLALSLVAAASVAAVALVVVLWALPVPVRAADAAATVASRVPRWDIPARMAVATTVVVTLTAIAPRLGAQLTGLLSPFPVYAAVLTVFAHNLRGSDSAVATLRGLVIGLFAFVAFFVVLAATLPRIGGAAFGAAAVVAGGVQGVSIAMARWSLPRRSRPGGRGWRREMSRESQGR